MSSFPKLLAFALVSTAMAGCSEPTSQRALDHSQSPALSQVGATLIECPIDSTRWTESTLDLLGGSLTLDGTTVDVPAGALLLPTTLRLTIPASRYMEIDVSVPGEEHFTFEEPITVTVDYSRCTRSNIDKASLSVWHIDHTTKALLENMNAYGDDKVARRISFNTGHLSGFALAD